MNKRGGDFAFCYVVQEKTFVAPPIAKGRNYKRGRGNRVELSTFDEKIFLVKIFL